MITFVRSAAIHDGKLADAFALAAKITDYIRTHYEGMNIEVSRNVGGPVFELHFVSTTESLTAYEDLNKRLEADEGYQAILNEVRQAGVFVGTSLTDRLYETVG